MEARKERGREGDKKRKMMGGRRGEREERREAMSD